jgi:hypothetical protein
VRRFDRDAIVARWDALINEAVGTGCGIGAAPMARPAPASFE